MQIETLQEGVERIQVIIYVIAMEKPRIIVICGPTGIGKTATTIRIAAEIDGQIVSADAMQVYRYMDIGTAKPSPIEQQQVKHHMIDIVDPDISFDAAQYADMGRRMIVELNSHNIVPYIVGGTGLYIKALLHGLYQSEPVDDALRIRLKDEAVTIGSEALHQRLSKVDPQTADKIHPNDTYRIIRALETFESTGKPISGYQHKHRFCDTPFEYIEIGLRMPRETLYERIDRRVDAMIDAGFVDEVRHLLDMGYRADLKSMQAIGYRHMAAFIQGRQSWNETVRTLKRDTRRYAKRQLTWFRAGAGITWIEPTRTRNLVSRIKKFLED
jgi:tRNA dimethylallyltransferase